MDKNPLSVGLRLDHGNEVLEACVVRRRRRSARPGALADDHGVLAPFVVLRQVPDVVFWMLLKKKIDWIW